MSATINTSPIPAAIEDGDRRQGKSTLHGHKDLLNFPTEILVSILHELYYLQLVRCRRVSHHP